MRIKGVDKNSYYTERSSYYIDQVTKNNLDQIPKKNVSQEENLNNKNGEQEEKEFLFTGKELLKAIESTNEKLQTYNSKIEFYIHKKTKDIMIRVVDADTGEIKREIPPKKMEDIIANILEKAGLLIDERV